MKRLALLLVLVASPAFAAWHDTADSFPPGGYSYGGHWSGTGVVGSFAGSAYAGRLEIEAIKVRIDSFSAFTAGSVVGEVYSAPLGCNQFTMSVSVRAIGTWFPASGGGEPIEDYEQDVSVTFYVGRNGYCRCDSGNGTQRDQRAPNGILAAIVAAGYPYRSGFSGEINESLSAVNHSSARLIEIIDRLALSIEERQDFTDLIPRCPSGVFDANDSGSGGGDDDETGSPDETDSDDDGVPDYKDLDPDDDEIGESWDVESSRLELAERLGLFDWGFDPASLTTGFLGATWTFDKPDGGTVSFSLSTLIDPSSPFGMVLDPIRLGVRAFILAMFGWWVFVAMYRDLNIMT